MVGVPEWRGARERCDTDRFLPAICGGFTGKGQMNIGASGRFVTGWEDREVGEVHEAALSTVNEALELKTFVCVERCCNVGFGVLQCSKRQLKLKLKKI